MAILNELQEKVAIYELNSMYFWSVDTNDVQGYLSAWHPEGISEAAYGSAKGHAELKERFVQMQNGMSRNKRHVVSNIVIDLNGNQATQKCYLTVLERENDAQVVATACYFDELIKTPEGWKFFKRKIQIDPNYKS